jgi:hypothetical protein
MVCFRLKRHVLNCFNFSDYDSLRDVRKKSTSDKNGGYIYIKFFFSLHIIRIVSVCSRFVLIFRKPHNEYFLTYEIITRIYMQAVNLKSELIYIADDLISQLQI